MLLGRLKEQSDKAHQEMTPISSELIEILSLAPLPAFQSLRGRNPVRTRPSMTADRKYRRLWAESRVECQRGNLAFFHFLRECNVLLAVQAKPNADSCTRILKRLADTLLITHTHTRGPADRLQLPALPSTKEPFALQRETIGSLAFASLRLAAAPSAGLKVRIALPLFLQKQQRKCLS